MRRRKYDPAISVVATCRQAAPLLCAALCAIVVSFSPLAACAAEGDVRTLTVAFIAPLTGPAAEHGAAARDGFELGLMQKGARHAVTTLFEDDALEPAKTVAAFKKLTDLHRIDVVIAMGSGPCNAIAGLADAKRIVFLALAGDTKVARGRPYVIRLRPPAAAEGFALAALASARGFSRVAAVCAENDFTSTVCNSFAHDLGAALVWRKDVLPADGDFQALLPQLATAKPDAVALLVMPGKIGVLARQLRERKVPGMLIGGAFFDSGSDFAISRGALAGAEYVGFAPTAQFVTDFGKSYTVTPSISWAAFLYNAAAMLSESVTQNKELLEYLKSVDGFDGALGTTRFVGSADDSYFDVPVSELKITEAGPGVAAR